MCFIGMNCRDIFIESFDLVCLYILEYKSHVSSKFNYK